MSWQNWLWNCSTNQVSKRVSRKKDQEGNFIPHGSVTGCISQLHKKLQHSQGSASCSIRWEQALKTFTLERAMGSNHSLSLRICTSPWTCPVWKTLDVHQNYFLHALVTTGELPVINSQVTNCCIQLNRHLLSTLIQNAQSCAFLPIFSDHHRLQRLCATYHLQMSHIVFWRIRTANFKSKQMYG